MKIFELRHSNSSKRALYFFGKKILTYVTKKFRTYELIQYPKFGVSYSVFDGEELLEASIKSIRSEVDYVNVVYQTISWRGNHCDLGLVTLLQDLKIKGLIDELIFWKPDLKKSPQVNETEKRNIGLKAAVKEGVNYFMTMDCDEFYFADEIAITKKKIVRENITHSYCKLLSYSQKPTLRNNIDIKRIVYIQLFCQVDKFSKLGANEFAPVLVDPTRKILERENSKHHVFSEITMHHMSQVRRNQEALNKKYDNSSGTAGRIEVVREGLIEVPNYFRV
jgi:hypothetical protein